MLSLVEPSNIPGTFTKSLPAEMSTWPALKVVRALSARGNAHATGGLGGFLKRDSDRIPYPTGAGLAEPCGPAGHEDPLGALSTGSAAGGTG